MTILDGLFQGIIQGATEFLPVSSDGHLTLYQHLTGNSGQGALFFNLMLHLGTLLAVFIVYYKDIWQLLCAFFKMLGEVFTGKFHFKTQDENRRMKQDYYDQVPRRWMGCGTVNSQKFLVDETGNRRFFPLTVTDKCLIDKFTSDREQVFAEALNIFNAEGNINPDIRFPHLAAHVWFCETKTAYVPP